MTVLQRILMEALGLVVLFFTVELIRRRRLREEYSLLWLLTGVVVLLFGLFPQILYWISRVLQLHHLTTMQLVTFLFLLLIVLHYSTVISQITDRETELAQHVALLTRQLEQLSRERAPDGPVRGDQSRSDCFRAPSALQR